MSLSLIKLLPRHGWSQLVDEMLALDSVVFLASVTLSYASLRSVRQAARPEAWAETIFLGGLLLVILSTLVLVHGIS